MTLPASGTISINQIATEFGGAAPYSLSNYYRGGAHVPNTVANQNIPTAGVISLSNFYSGSNIVSPWTPTFTVGSAGNSGINLFYGNGLYVMGTGNGQIYTSPNGVTWTLRYTQPNGYSFIGQGAYGNGIYVMGVSELFNTYVTSTDGITWTQRTTGTGQHSLDQIAFGNGTFVMTGGFAVYTSTNGTTWTEHLNPFGTTAPYVYYSTYGLSFVNGVFVAGGAYTLTTPYTGFIATSTNGVTWTTQTTTSSVAANAAYGNGTYIVTAGSLTYNSANLTTWTSETPPAPPTGITYGTQFIITTNTGNFYKSATGAAGSWSPSFVQSGSSLGYSSVLYVGGQYITAGNYVLTSTAP